MGRYGVHGNRNFVGGSGPEPPKRRRHSKGNHWPMKSDQNENEQDKENGIYKERRKKVESMRRRIDESEKCAGKVWKVCRRKEAIKAGGYQERTEEVMRTRTNDETWQVENVAANVEAECGWHRRTVGLEKHAMRVHGLCRVLECVRGKVLPVLDHRLVLEKLGTSDGMRRGGEKRIGESTHLPDVLALAKQFLFRPICEHAELGSHKADFARPPPYNGRSTDVRDQLVELLHHRAVCSSHRRGPQSGMKQRRTMMDRCSDFSTNTSSSSVSGIWSAMSEGRKIASARTMRKMSFFSNLYGGRRERSRLSHVKVARRSPQTHLCGRIFMRKW